MSSPGPPPLPELHHLNRSSPDFHDQLNNILHGKEYQERVPNLQGGDLAWLAEYLDKVRRHVTFPHPPLKPS